MITPVRSSKETGWIKRYIKEYRFAFVAAIILSVLAYLFASALMFTSGYMISLAAAVPLTVLALHVPSLFVRIFGIGKPLIRYAERLVSHNWVLRMTSHMRVRLYDALAARTSALCSKERLGDLLDMLTDDIGHAQDLFLRGILPLASSVILALLVVVAAGAFSWQLCLFMVVFLAVVVLLLPLMSSLINGARMAHVKNQKTLLYQEVSDDITGMADWILAGREQECADRAASMTVALNAEEARVRRYSRRSDLASQVVFCVAIVTLLVWASLVFAGSGSATCLSDPAAFLATLGNENAPAYAPNWIAAFVICFFPLIEAFMPTSHAALSFDSQRKALRRLDKFSLVEGEPVDEEDLQPLGFDVAFANVTFGYEDAPNKLIGSFSVAVPEGTRIALLGRSGVGKTTVASLLHGDCVPSEGSVTIGGVPAHELASHMPEFVGIIRQDPFLFNLTLRDNLRLASPTATDDVLIEMLEKVGLGERYRTLSKGLDTVLDGHGTNFSGGEKQRIALARILLANQPIVILDEPFVGIDAETERLLMETCMKELAGKTVFVITHHLQNIELFDQVIFMQRASEGECSIAFKGTPQELAATNQMFQKLLQMDR